MSIEYLGTPTPPLDEGRIAALLLQLAHSEGFRPVRRTDSELGLVSTNAAEMTPETTTIGLSADEVYLAFHVETRDERKRLLGITPELLREGGVECDLEEQ